MSCKHDRRLFDPWEKNAWSSSEAKTQRIIYSCCINLLPIHVHNEFYELLPLSHQNCGHDECFLTALDVRLRDLCILDLRWNDGRTPNLTVMNAILTCHQLSTAPEILTFPLLQLVSINSGVSIRRGGTYLMARHHLHNYFSITFHICRQAHVIAGLPVQAFREATSS